jgi:hypothetical protein
VSSLDKHKLAECDKITVSCALKDFGCSDLVIRVQMSNHYMTEQHQNAITTLIRRVLLKSSNNQHERSSSMEIDILPHTTTTMISSTNDKSNAQLQQVYETIDTLAGGLQALNDDTQRLSNESLELHIKAEDLNLSLAALKLSIQEENAFLGGIKPNQEILNQDVATLKEKVEDMQSVSYDGMIIWKITSFKERMSKIFTLHLFRSSKLILSLGLIVTFN